jgi:predicted DNA-binding protein (MmcQ/YjbR family)
MTKEELFAWIRAEFEVEPDYPWNDGNAVLRHRENNKWFGLVMSVQRAKLGLSGNGAIDVLNIKGDPDLICFLRTQKGYLPAYHMNKNSWITIVLEDFKLEDEIKNLVSSSFKETSPKIKRARSKQE